MEFFEKEDVKVIREDNFKNENNIESESLNNERFVTGSKDSNSSEESGDSGNPKRPGPFEKTSYDDFNRVLRSALVGEERARAKILHMLDPLIRSSIRKYCPVYSEFEDLYSDGRVMVLVCLDDFDGKRSFLKYVKEFLRYTYLNNYKYLTNVERDIHDDDTDEEGQSILDSLDAGVDIEGDFLESEESDLVRAAMKSLTPRQATVVRLFYYERLGLSEIADFLGISKWTVVNLKRTGLEKMRKFILNSYNRR